MSLLVADLPNGGRAAAEAPLRSRDDPGVMLWQCVTPMFCLECSIPLFFVQAAASHNHPGLHPTRFEWYLWAGRAEGVKTGTFN